MTRPRVSLARLLALIAALALAMAVLRSPSALELTIPAAVIALAIAHLGEILLRRPPAFLHGFVVAGWGYLILLILLPYEIEPAPLNVDATLTTTWLIDALHDRTHPRCDCFARRLWLDRGDEPERPRVDRKTHRRGGHGAFAILAGCAGGLAFRRLFRWRAARLDAISEELPDEADRLAT